MVFTSGLNIGKYELGRKLGQGSFGLVFTARDTELEREVAIKLVHPSLATNAEVVRRFVVEARSAAKIVHPGIVTVFECGQVTGTQTSHDGVPYIAMELLHGESLADRLVRAGQLAPETAAEIGRQIASALEAAHRAGVVHRDLKPDNIFLVTDPAMPEGERVKVLDFGIAKLAGTQSSAVQTQSMMVFGTPRYMSPEQCRSAAHIDHRSDIYTLGCILYELIVGVPPFTGAVGDVLAKHLMIVPPTPRSAVGAVPDYLDQLIACMLAKDPAQRPQTMAAVQRALEAGATHARGIAPTIGVTASLVPDRARGSLPQAAPVPTTLGGASGESPVARPLRRRTLPLVIGALVGVAVGFGLLVVRREPPAPQVTAVSPPPGAMAKDDLRSAMPADPTSSLVEPPKPVPEPVATAPKPVARVAKAVKASKPVVTAPVVTTPKEAITAPTPDVTAPRPPVASCDAGELERKGQAAYVSGRYAAALRAFDAAYQCKPTPNLATKTVMAACSAGDIRKAHQLWRVLAPQSRRHAMPVCARHGVTMDPPTVQAIGSPLT